MGLAGILAVSAFGLVPAGLALIGWAIGDLISGSRVMLQPTLLVYRVESPWINRLSVKRFLTLSNKPAPSCAA